jgi:hypothetical protein
MTKTSSRRLARAERVAIVGHNRILHHPFHKYSLKEAQCHILQNGCDHDTKEEHLVR